MASRKNRNTQVAQIEDVEVVEGGEDVVVQNEAPVEEQVVEQAPEGEGEGETEQAEAGTHCAMCGRMLTAEQSVIRGMGPVCAGHVARLAKAEGLSLTAKAETEGYIDEAKLADLIEAAKTAPAVIAPDDFNADENEHPSFPERGPMAFVKLAEVHKAVVEQGRSLTAFVKAFGGDRAQQEPLSEDWTPVYVGRTRYLPATVLDRIAEDLPEVRVRAPKAPAETEGEAPEIDGETGAEVEADEAETPAEAEDTGEEAA
jgi:hypothetical protein